MYPGKAVFKYLVVFKYLACAKIWIHTEVQHRVTALEKLQSRKDMTENRNELQ